MSHCRRLGKSGCSQEMPWNSLRVPISIQGGGTSPICGLWGVKPKAAGKAVTHRSHSPSQPLLLSGEEYRARDDKGCQDAL